LRTGDADLRF